MVRQAGGDSLGFGDSQPNAIIISMGLGLLCFLLLICARSMIYNCCSFVVGAPRGWRRPRDNVAMNLISNDTRQLRVEKRKIELWTIDHHLAMVEVLLKQYSPVGRLF